MGERIWLDINAVSRLLLKEVAGDQRAWARKHGISPQYVSDVLNGRRLPGDKITRALGLEKALLWRASYFARPTTQKGDRS